MLSSNGGCISSVLDFSFSRLALAEELDSVKLVITYGRFWASSQLFESIVFKVR